MDVDTTVGRVQTSLAWLRGGTGGKKSSGQSALGYDFGPSSFVHEAAGRTKGLMEVGLRDEALVVPTSGYMDATGRGDFCLLNDDLVAIPEASQAATANPLEILPPEDQYICSFAHLVKPREEWPSPLDLSESKVKASCLDGHYPRLVLRLLRAGMAELRERKDGVVENSIFGVWKRPGLEQRLIWAGNRSNRLFRPEASSIELPTPDLLATMYLAEGDELVLGGCDISQQYNRLAVVKELIPLLGLPGLPASKVMASVDDRIVVPCLKVVPMGATFAVMLAQSVSRAIVNRVLLTEGKPPWSTASVLDHDISDEQATVVYLDDINAVSTSDESCNEFVERVRVELRLAGLPTSTSKDIIADQAESAEALGLTWWRSGCLTPKPAVIVKILRQTTRFIGTRFGSPNGMRRLLGLWIWIFLLRRPLLSVFQDVFTFSRRDRPSASQRIPDGALVELNVALDLLPLAFADLRRPLSCKLFASDASLRGAGVVYTQRDDMKDFLTRISETRSRKGWPRTLRLHGLDAGAHDLDLNELCDDQLDARMTVSDDFESALASCSFKVAISTPWRFRNTLIDELELQASLLAVRRMVKDPSLHGTRVPHLLDSTVGLGALAKGRSGIPRLNTVCRKIASFLLPVNLFLLAHWVPSRLNPADDPSRVFTFHKAAQIRARGRDSAKDR